MPDSGPFSVAKTILKQMKNDALSVNYADWQKVLELVSPEERGKLTEELEKFIAGDAKHALIYREWGIELARLARYAEGEVYLRKAIELDPADSFAYYGLAVVLANLDKFEEAIKQYGEAIRLKPDYPEAYYGSGLAQDKLEKYAEAAKQYEEAVRRRPEYVEACYRWGVALAKIDQYEEAIKKYQLVIGLQSSYVDAYYGWGLASAKLKNYKEAIEKYEEAVRLTPDYADVHNSWGAALANLEKYEEAIEKYKETLRLQPDHVGAHQNWGLALANLEKYEEAIEQYKEALRLQPDYVGAHQNWGLALANLEKHEEAIEQYKEAIRLKSDYVSAHYNYGIALANLNRYEEAIEKYKEAIRLKPDHADAYYGWGLALAKLERYEEATQQYKEATGLKDNYVEVYKNWGDALINLEKFPEAIVRYQKAVELSPQNVNAVIGWGKALLNLQRETEAEQKLQQALSIDPEQPPSIADRYYNWGNILSDFGRIEDAIQQYAEAIQADFDHAYSYHNTAYYREKQGRYKESWASWESASRAYKNGLATARKNRNADYFNYFGWIRNKLGRTEAEETFLEGLEIDPRHTGILSSLVDFYLEQKDELNFYWGKPDRERRGVAHTKARNAFRKAEALLKTEEKNNPTNAPHLQLGQLYLAIEDYVQAQTRLTKAAEQDKESAEVQTYLGVLYSRKEEYPKAIDCFREALRLDPEDLTIRSNLADAYLNAKLPDKAEGEYQKILSITSNHIESEIGLGQVCVARADDKASKDPELYEEAIHHFERAIDLGKTEPCSVSSRLKPKKWAALYYSLARARVQLHGSSKFLKGDSPLNRALEEIKLCLKNDPEHYKAISAKKKILDKIRPTSTERAMEKIGPITIFGASTFLFVFTQACFFRGILFKEMASYIPMTFGSLVLMIAGLSLPRLLKLKVAGIELEKSSVDQITTSGTVEISK